MSSTSAARGARGTGRFGASATSSAVAATTSSTAVIARPLHPTVLMRAVSSERLDVVEETLEPAYAHFRDTGDDGPLQRILFDTDRDGRTALDWARRMRLDEIATTLERMMERLIRRIQRREERFRFAQTQLQVLQRHAAWRASLRRAIAAGRPAEVAKAVQGGRITRDQFEKAVEAVGCVERLRIATERLLRRPVLPGLLSGGEGGEASAAAVLPTSGFVDPRVDPVRDSVLASLGSVAVASPNAWTPPHTFSSDAPDDTGFLAARFLAGAEVWARASVLEGGKRVILDPATLFPAAVRSERARAGPHSSSAPSASTTALATSASASSSASASASASVLGVPSTSSFVGIASIEIGPSTLELGLESIAPMAELDSSSSSASSASPAATPPLSTLLADVTLDFGPYAIDAESTEGRTAMEIACAFGDSPLVRELVARGASVNHETSRGMTPLMWTAHCGEHTIIPVLISMGADVFRASRIGGRTALITAVARGQIRPLKAILDGVALRAMREDARKVNSVNPRDVADRNVPSLHWLRETLDRADQSGRTALQWLLRRDERAPLDADRVSRVEQRLKRALRLLRNDTPLDEVLAGVHLDDSFDSAIDGEEARRDGAGPARGGGGSGSGSDSRARSRARVGGMGGVASDDEDGDGDEEEGEGGDGGGGEGRRLRGLRRITAAGVRVEDGADVRQRAAEGVALAETMARLRERVAAGAVDAHGRGLAALALEMAEEERHSELLEVLTTFYDRVRQQRDRWHQVDRILSLQDAKWVKLEGVTAAMHEAHRTEAATAGRAAPAPERRPSFSKLREATEASDIRAIVLGDLDDGRTRLTSDGSPRTPLYGDRNLAAAKLSKRDGSERDDRDVDIIHVLGTDIVGRERRRAERRRRGRRNRPRHREPGRGDESEEGEEGRAGSMRRVEGGHHGGEEDEARSGGDESEDVLSDEAERSDDSEDRRRAGSDEDDDDDDDGGDDEAGTTTTPAQDEAAVARSVLRQVATVWIEGCPVRVVIVRYEPRTKMHLVRAVDRAWVRSVQRQVAAVLRGGSEASSAGLSSSSERPRGQHDAELRRQLIEAVLEPKPSQLGAVPPSFWTQGSGPSLDFAIQQREQLEREEALKAERRARGEVDEEEIGEDEEAEAEAEAEVEEGGKSNAVGSGAKRVGPRRPAVHALSEGVRPVPRGLAWMEAQDPAFVRRRRGQTAYFWLRLPRYPVKFHGTAPELERPVLPASVLFRKLRNPSDAGSSTARPDSAASTDANASGTLPRASVSVSAARTARTGKRVAFADEEEHEDKDEDKDEDKAASPWDADAASPSIAVRDPLDAIGSRVPVVFDAPHAEERRRQLEPDELLDAGIRVAHEAEPVRDALEAISSHAPAADPIPRSSAWLSAVDEVALVRFVVGREDEDHPTLGGLAEAVAQRHHQAPPFATYAPVPPVPRPFPIAPSAIADTAEERVIPRSEFQSYAWMQSGGTSAPFASGSGDGSGSRNGASLLLSDAEGTVPTLLNASAAASSILDPRLLWADERRPPTPESWAVVRADRDLRALYPMNEQVLRGAAERQDADTGDALIAALAPHEEPPGDGPVARRRHLELLGRGKAEILQLNATVQDLTSESRVADEFGLEPWPDLRERVLASSYVPRRLKAQAAALRPDTDLSSIAVRIAAEELALKAAEKRRWTQIRARWRTEAQLAASEAVDPLNPTANSQLASALGVRVPRFVMSAAQEAFLRAGVPFEFLFDADTGDTPLGHLVREHQRLRNARAAAESIGPGLGGQFAELGIADYLAAQGVYEQSVREVLRKQRGGAALAAAATTTGASSAITNGDDEDDEDGMDEDEEEEDEEEEDGNGLREGEEGGKAGPRGRPGDEGRDPSRRQKRRARRLVTGHPSVYDQQFLACLGRFRDWVVFPHPGSLLVRFPVASDTQAEEDARLVEVRSRLADGTERVGESVKGAKLRKALKDTDVAMPEAVSFLADEDSSPKRGGGGAGGAGGGGGRAKELAEIESEDRPVTDDWLGRKSAEDIHRERRRALAAGWGRGATEEAIRKQRRRRRGGHVFVPGDEIVRLARAGVDDPAVRARVYAQMLAMLQATPVAERDEAEHRALETIVEAGGGAMIVMDPLFGSNPLIRAAREGDLEVLMLFIGSLGLRALMEEGADGHSALTAACFAGQIKSAELLLDAGCSVFHETSRGFLPLLEAVRSGHLELVRVLVERFSAQVTQANRFGIDAVSLAHRLDLHDIRIYIDAHMRMHVALRDLFVAILRHRNDVVKMLLDGGIGHRTNHLASHRWELRHLRRLRFRGRRQVAALERELQQWQEALARAEGVEERRAQRMIARVQRGLVAPGADDTGPNLAALLRFDPSPVRPPPPPEPVESGSDDDGGSGAFGDGHSAMVGRGIGDEGEEEEDALEDLGDGDGSRPTRPVHRVIATEGRVHIRFLRKEMHRAEVRLEGARRDLGEVERRLPYADRRFWVARLVSERVLTGHTAFSWACACGNLRAAELLLQRGADPTCVDVRFSLVGSGVGGGGGSGGGSADSDDLPEWWEEERRFERARRTQRSAVSAQTLFEDELRSPTTEDASIVSGSAASEGDEDVRDAGEGLFEDRVVPSFGQSAVALLESFVLYYRWNQSEPRRLLTLLGVVGKKVAADAAMYLQLHTSVRKFRDARALVRVPAVEAAFNGHERIVRWLALLAERWGFQTFLQRSFVRPLPMFPRVLPVGIAAPQNLAAPERPTFSTEDVDREGRASKPKASRRLSIGEAGAVGQMGRWRRRHSLAGSLEDQNAGLGSGIGAADAAVGLQAGALVVRSRGSPSSSPTAASHAADTSALIVRERKEEDEASAGPGMIVLPTKKDGASKLAANAAKKNRHADPAENDMYALRGPGSLPCYGIVEAARRGRDEIGWHVWPKEGESGWRAGKRGLTAQGRHWSHDAVVLAGDEGLAKLREVTEDSSATSVRGRRKLLRTVREQKALQERLWSAMAALDFAEVLRCAEEGASTEASGPDSLGGHSALTWACRHAAYVPLRLCRELYGDEYRPPPEASSEFRDRALRRVERLAKKALRQEQGRRASQDLGMASLSSSMRLLTSSVRSAPPISSLFELSHVDSTGLVQRTGPVASPARDERVPRAVFGSSLEHPAQVGLDSVLLPMPLTTEGEGEGEGGAAGRPLDGDEEAVLDTLRRGSLVDARELGRLLALVTSAPGDADGGLEDGDGFDDEGDDRDADFDGFDASEEGGASVPEQALALARRRPPAIHVPPSIVDSGSVVSPARTTAAARLANGAVAGTAVGTSPGDRSRGRRGSVGSVMDAGSVWEAGSVVGGRARVRTRTPREVMVCACLLDRAKARVRPNHVTRTNLSPLGVAAAFGHTFVMHALLKRGALIDFAAEPERLTPLMFAARTGQLKAIAFLLEQGADARLVDAEGRDAWSHAREFPRAQHLLSSFRFTRTTGFVTAAPAHPAALHVPRGIARGSEGGSATRHDRRVHARLLVPLASSSNGPLLVGDAESVDAWQSAFRDE